METMQGEAQPSGISVLLTIAGFWRRLGALIVDLLLLGVVGWLIGLVLFDTLARMGDWARIIGFVIALAYFGLLDSRLCAGRTLGNRLFDLRVINASGNSLSIPRSLVRYTVLSTPFFLNNLSVSKPSLVVSLVLSVVVLGGILSITYLYLFNRRTRQSLHDLAVGSYAVRGESEGSTVAFPVLWRGHLVVVGVIFALCLAGALAAASFVKSTTFAPLVAAQQAMNALPNVQTSGVVDGVSYFNGARSTYLSAQLRLATPQIYDEAFARQVAQLIFKSNPDAASRSVITVNLVYGFDLGIARGWKSHLYRFTPMELM